LALAAAQPMLRTEEEILNLWESWKEEYNVVYETEGEEAHRFSVFLNNYVAIHEHMKKDPNVELGLNKFATLTSEEFGEKMKCLADASDLSSDKDGKLCNGMNSGETCPKYDQSNVPDTYDWRTKKGALSPVKNQGECGSCWAFSTTGSLENLYWLNHTTSMEFSEQQLVDCDQNDHGCEGGLMAWALNYVAAFGVETEKEYPYNAVDESCHYDSNKAIATNTGCNCVTPKSIIQLEAAISHQAVSIAVQANQISWQFYKGGVISDFCGDRLDHGVLAVGYNTIKDKAAWIVKNSWGADWGAEGYVYIERNSKNNGAGSCGVLAQPVIPTNVPK